MEKENDSLIHYGVLGMKWGVRKAKKKGTTYSYKSMATKSYEKKASKTNDPKKKKKFTTFAKNSKKLDKKLLNYSKKASVGKTVLSNILSRDFGRTYQQLRSLDVEKGRAIVDGMLFPYAGNIQIANYISTGKLSYKKKKKK